ncbi:MAG: helix-turn-helix transcriptional regulator [Pseudomonadales bacterium]
MSGSLFRKTRPLLLNISTVTVKRHSANIFQKLGVHVRRQAVAKAPRPGHVQSFPKYS